MITRKVAMKAKTAGKMDIVSNAADLFTKLEQDELEAKRRKEEQARQARLKEDAAKQAAAAAAAAEAAALNPPDATAGDANANLKTAEEEEADEEEDPCFGYIDSDEEEGDEEEEEEEEIPEFPPDTASVKDTGPVKKYRRHHFIKHEICLPDNRRKCAPPPKGRPWYAAPKKTLLERRMDSTIAFIMPKQEDPEVLALRRTNKMIQKLIKYMKVSWKVRIDRKQAERELEHRTLPSVYTKKPDDWLEKIRAREDRALKSGFFSAMDLPYEALVDLQLDTALLSLYNLPPDLKITAGRWIRAKLRKEELKRKRDAYLPRLPHGRVKRPSYSKGRLIKDPGGVSKVDQFVRVAEGFLKISRGNKPFSKVLKDWTEKKEKEGINSNSGFGVVRDGMFDFKKKKTSTSTGRKSNDAGAGFKAGSDARRVSIVDAKKYQRDMLYYEKMLGAMFDIVKSLLNIKTKQMESKFPLPPTAVAQLRARSPDRATVPKNLSTPLLILQREAEKAKQSSIIGFGHKSFNATSLGLPDGMEPLDPTLPEQETKSNTEKNRQDPEGGGVRKSLAAWVEGEANKVKPSALNIKERISKIKVGETVNVKDITAEPPRSSKPLIDALIQQLSLEDLHDVQGRRQTITTAEAKIQRLNENPEHAAIRRARNYMTYTKLFERNRKIKKPVWQDIDITTLASDLSGSKGLTGKDAANLTEADAAEVVDLAMKKRKEMKQKKNFGDDEETKRRWPEEFDIPTPTYQFTESKIKIPSEEQSKQNLLKKTPYVDEVPGTPVRRLFKLAGVRTTEKDILNNILEMKKMFRLTENQLRVYYENEIGKLEWDTLKRFRGKLTGIKPSPVFQWTIALMRLHYEQEGKKALGNPKKSIVYVATPAAEKEGEGEEGLESNMKQKRPASWYKKLKEECDQNGATRHTGCQSELQNLLRYCDVDLKTKPHMLNRLALLVVSLPTTELGTRHWQEAVVFLLEHMCGTPPEMIHLWLKYRGIPFLL